MICSILFSIFVGINCSYFEEKTHLFSGGILHAGVHRFLCYNSVTLFYTLNIEFSVFYTMQGIKSISTMLTHSGHTSQHVITVTCMTLSMAVKSMVLLNSVFYSVS